MHFTVTVTMPVYNGEKFLREAIDSILNQTFENFELIIIDDGSTDESLKCAQSYTDQRIRILRNEGNKGLVFTRNRGCAEAKGKYIAILDCDDIAYPTRLAEQVEFLEKNQEFGMIGSWIDMIDENSALTGQVMRYTASPEEIPIILLFSNYFAQSSLLIRKSVLPPQPYRSYPGAEDYDLWVRIAKNTKVWNLQKSLVKYRVHQSSITFTNATNISSYVKNILCNQLHALGVEPSQEELDIHTDIGRGAHFSSLPAIRQAEAWLLKLYAANKKTSHFQSQTFESFLGNKWFSICSTASAVGLPAWQVFQASSLCKHAPRSRYLQGEFFLRCLMKWQVH